MIVLETARLFLRHATEADAEALYILESDPEVLRHIGRKPLGDIEAYRAFIRSRFLPWYDRPGGFGAWIIVEKSSGDFLGVSSLRPAEESRDVAIMGYAPGEVELGYGLRRASWGQGYATEVATALLRRALTELGAVRVVASVSMANLASIRVLEKIGMVRTEGLFQFPDEDVPSLKYIGVAS
jgi:RimJ/RimL family protein N-acetyltransferase